MATYMISARFIEICTSDYVLDHCNGDDECLIGVSLAADMKESDILDSATDEAGMHDKIPAGITCANIRTALESPCSAVSQTLAGMVACGHFDEDSDAPYADIEALAWIRITWSVVEEGI